MTTSKSEIFVYAHWAGMHEPYLIGILNAQQIKGKKAFSFEYHPDWIQTSEQILLDPDIGWYQGHQYPNNKDNFGLFFDSRPDTWGKTLMKRRAIHKSKAQGAPVPNLYDIDYLLGVNDEGRMGALRFKIDPEGDFLDNEKDNPIPPISSIRELQYAAKMIETEDDYDNVKKWLTILMAPGSSLGGARPKANVKDTYGELWIAKFPSKADVIDKSAWEFLAYKIAIQAGINMAESRIERIAGNNHTFFTKRFDRLRKERVHFASAMTMTGNNEETIKEKPASYLDIAEFIHYSGAKSRADLAQLWRRIVFNIAISNTDDHLRNHGFILTPGGWTLSPAFDINPSVDKYGLALNIDPDDNALDIDLAKSVGEYFQLNTKAMNTIASEIDNAVKNWKSIAHSIGISKSEQEIMAPAFNQLQKS